MKKFPFAAVVVALPVLVIGIFLYLIFFKELDSSPLVLMLPLATVLLAAMSISLCYRALKGSKGSLLMLWILAPIMCGFYFLMVSGNGSELYRPELFTVVLLTSLAGNAILMFLLYLFKERFRDVSGYQNLRIFGE